ncbi:soluble calcium-activated nucleotidase 1-like isoform X2 [Clavelina lepadiformis]|uniref:soluble calcium-activated nucleotidase 1-like isoform X2 n=1 Tax=Clavelina lepadiformis TaxID=159417 RepID=UPI004041DBF7
MYKSVSFSSFGTKDNVNIEAWRNKIDVPVFSQGRRKVTLKYKPILAAVLVLLGITFFYHYSATSVEDDVNQHINPRFLGKEILPQRKLMSYNRTYPLTKPVATRTGSSFRIGIITDMDKASKYPEKSNTWKSLLRYGNLSFDNQTLTASVKWEDDDSEGKQLLSSYSYGGRGMELSELVVFNGHVYSVDDRTGIVYEILDGRVAPWVILSDGNGHETKGFKGEWMTIKDEKLYLGGLGKEWTTADGVVLHSNPQWIKTIDKDGAVTHLDWVPKYTAMQRASGYEPPGYIIHESAVWSDVHKSWFFLPRRASHEQYDEDLDELRATNILFQCSEDFSHIKVTRIGKLEHKARGFSSFKFVPGTNDQVIVALKTEELKGSTRSYITAFTLSGQIVLPDQQISSQYKFEGVEFL